MKKRRKGKVRWLSVLLTGCLLLSIIPATAFAAEDTAPAKSENSAGEEIQMPEQQNATEDTSNSVIENTSEDAIQKIRMNRLINPMKSHLRKLRHLPSSNQNRIISLRE